jgi:hypothetical protein
MASSQRTTSRGFVDLRAIKRWLTSRRWATFEAVSA